MQKHGKAWQSMAKQGNAWQSMAKHGKAWQSMPKHGKACQSMAKHGKVWQSMAKHDKAWQSMTKHSKAWQSMAKLSYAVICCHMLLYAVKAVKQGSNSDQTVKNSGLRQTDGRTDRQTEEKCRCWAAPSQLKSLDSGNWHTGGYFKNIKYATMLFISWIES